MRNKQALPNPRSQDPEREKEAAALKIRDMAPRLKVQNKSGRPVVSPDFTNEPLGYALIAKAIGAYDFDFLNGILSQLTNLVSDGSEINEGKLNFLLSVIKDIEPRNQIEAMLAAQMAAVHLASMQSASRLALSQFTMEADSAGRVFGKLSQIFLNQMEALKRFRAGAEQKPSSQSGATVDAGDQSSATSSGNTPGRPEAEPAAVSDDNVVKIPNLDGKIRTPQRGRKYG